MTDRADFIHKQQINIIDAKDFENYVNGFFQITGRDVPPFTVSDIANSSAVWAFNITPFSAEDEAAIEEIDSWDQGKVPYCPCEISILRYLSFHGLIPYGIYLLAADGSRWRE